jgi:hypothetical protein
MPLLIAVGMNDAVLPMLPLPLPFRSPTSPASALSALAASAAATEGKLASSLLTQLRAVKALSARSTIAVAPTTIENSVCFSRFLMAETISRFSTPWICFLRSFEKQYKDRPLASNHSLDQGANFALG